MMWKEFSAQGSYKWLNLLPKIVEKYNNTVHRTTGMKPVDVDSKVEKSLLKTVYNYKKVDPKTPKFQFGDYVRISRNRNAFTKGYTPNWSNEVFQINEVSRTFPTTYHLKDSRDQEIKGGFYEFELQKVKYPDVYLVEKILRRKGNHLFVKWLGMDKSHNSWISKFNVA